MNTVWVITIGGVLIGCIALGLAVWCLWSRRDPEGSALVRRVTRLPLRDKLRLALALARDSRIPLALRVIPPGLVLYLATPIDLIPDFIPVIGHLDDMVILIVGVGLLLRFTPRYVVEEHVARLESAEHVGWGL